MSCQLSVFSCQLGVRSYGGFWEILERKMHGVCSEHSMFVQNAH